MADIYCSHFEFAGIDSSAYKLIIASVESERMLKLSGDIEGVTIFNKVANKRYLINDNMADSPLSFEVEIVTDDQSIISYQDRRAIEKWLFNKHDYRKLYMNVNDDPNAETFENIDGVLKRNYLNCRFINPQKLEYNGGIVGYSATLEADSSMFWQDAIVKEFTSDDDMSDIIIKVDTDLDAYTYPLISFTVGSVGGDVTIINHTDSTVRKTKFIGLSPYDTVVMRGEVNYVSGQYYEKFFDRNFVRLLDGNNHISVDGDVASISIEFQNRRAF